MTFEKRYLAQITLGYVNFYYRRCLLFGTSDHNF